MEAPAAQPAEPVVVSAKPRRAKKAEAPAPAAPAAEVNRRITVGTPIVEWRVVKSQRVNQSGWFVQGGEYREENGKRPFYVAEEHLYPTVDAARKAALIRQPAK